MTIERGVPDPNEKDTFQPVNRRAGYDPKLERLIAWAKAGNTLYAGEGAMIVAHFEELLSNKRPHCPNCESSWFRTKHHVKTGPDGKAELTDPATWVQECKLCGTEYKASEALMLIDPPEDNDIDPT